jgi:serine/threonine protein kinase
MQARMIGSTVSHYRILDKLGEGGMGIVYKAQDTRLERLVALKFLPTELARLEVARQRFIKEARAASALNHPNVAVVYDVGETDTQSFIAMELVEGETLKARLRGERLTIEEIQELALQIAEGLQAAHAKGIVHRDIKPDNLLLTPNGCVKIMDFGIAKVADEQQLTQTGTTLGTLAYMSPEQLLADNVDHRSDLWSLGVVLYEMLAREVPFRRDREAAILYEILNRSPSPRRAPSPARPDPATAAERPDATSRIGSRRRHDGAKQRHRRGATGGPRQVDRRALLREHELRSRERLHLRRHHRGHHHRPVETERAARGVTHGHAAVPEQGSEHTAGG